MYNSLNTSTITELVTYGKSLDFSHAKIHLKSKFNVSGDGHVVILNYESLLDKYTDLINDHVTTVTLSDAEYAKYKFQPKLMCYDTYGTTEIWSSLLRINNLMSASQFTLQTLKMFTSDIFDVINEIFILEEKTIRDNNAEVYGS